MVATTNPEDIAQYSIRVVDSWKLGRAKPDDGVLLLLAKDDHATRIEVGYGLEGALTDATSNRIIDETMKPLFRQGQFYAGLSAGVAQIMQVVDGEALPPPDQSWKSKRQRPVQCAADAVDRLSGGLLDSCARSSGASAARPRPAGVLGLVVWVLSQVRARRASAWPWSAFCCRWCWAWAAPAGARAGAAASEASGAWRLGGGGFGGGGFGGGGFGGGGGGFGGGGASGRW